MKLIYALLIPLLFCSSCIEKKAKDVTEKIETESEKLKRITDRVENNLSYDQEKIFLLSEIRNVDFDTLNMILTDYYVFADTLSISDERSKRFYKDAITDISKKYKISKSKIASLIFSYEYEMIKREDIEEEAVDNFIIDNEPDYYEPSDPY